MFTTYTVLLSLHVLAAVLWVGGGITLHLMGRLAMKSGDRQRMLAFSRDGDVIGPRFYAPLSLVLIVAGVLLVDEVGADMSDTWIALGIAGWVLSFLIGVLYYPRAGKRREAIVEAEGTESDAFLAIFRQIMNVNVFEIVILVLVVLDMTLRPGT
jgi:uncharacterized membrane protein